MMSNPVFQFRVLVCLTAILLSSCQGPEDTLRPASPDHLSLERAYQGSVFSQLKAAVWQRPYDSLPIYHLSRDRLFSEEFERNSARTIDTHVDLLETERLKIVHPNGICLTGVWQINQENPYSGYFAKGRRGLVLARISSEGDQVALPNKSKPVSDHWTGQKYISYGLAAKLFPTGDVEDPRPYRPAHLIVQTDIGGQASGDVSTVAMTNAPDVTVKRRGFAADGFVGGGVRILARSGRAFDAVDEQNTIRQTYEIAELDKPAATPTSAPKYLKLTAAPRDRRQLGEGDFRLAIEKYIENRGALSFDIWVANRGKKVTITPLLQKTRVEDPWIKIGELTFTDAVNSRACDARLHFHHPAWRQDRNEPASQVRPRLPIH